MERQNCIESLNKAQEAMTKALEGAKDTIKAIVKDRGYINLSIREDDNNTAPVVFGTAVCNTYDEEDIDIRAKVVGLEYDKGKDDVLVYFTDFEDDTYYEGLAQVEEECLDCDYLNNSEDYELVMNILIGLEDFL